MKLRLGLLVCIGFVGGVVLAELAARVIWRQPFVLPMRTSTPEDIEKRAQKIPSGPAPRGPYGSFTYDENGFRVGTGLPYEQSILFVGDSFTEGFGVSDDETFARATENTLRRDGFKVRSLNAGMRGFGAAQELTVLRHVLAQLPVDAIVLQSFPMNDLSDNLAYGAFGIADGRLVEYEPRRAPLRARLAGAIDRSWLRELYVARGLAGALLAVNGPAPYDAPTSFDLEAALLRECVSTARQRGTPIVMLVIPTKLVQEAQHSADAPSPQQMAEIRRFERVRALVDDLGIPWIDAGRVIPDLAADAAQSDGAHFSKDGNARIGEAIAHELAPLLRPVGGERPNAAAGHAGARLADAPRDAP